MPDKEKLKISKNATEFGAGVLIRECDVAIDKVCPVKEEGFDFDKIETVISIYVTKNIYMQEDFKK